MILLFQTVFFSFMIDPYTLPPPFYLAYILDPSLVLYKIWLVHSVTIFILVMICSHEITIIGHISLYTDKISTYMI